MKESPQLQAFPGTVSYMKGENAFAKDRELSRIRSLYEDKGFTYEHYHLPEDTQALESSLYTPSFFASSKFIVVEGFEALKKKGERRLLTEYAAKTSKDIVLLLRSADRKRVSAWVEKEIGLDSKVEYKIPDKWDMGSWLRDYAKSEGVGISKDHCEAIVLNVGDDLYALANEISKIKVYCDGRVNATQEDIEAVLFQHSATSPFDVVKLWGLKETATCLRYFLNLLENSPKSEWVGCELVILSTLQERVEALLKAKAYQNSGMSRDTIASKLGLNSWVYRNNVEPQLKARDVFELETAYIRLAEIEPLIKTGQPGYLLLEAFLSSY